MMTVVEDIVKIEAPAVDVAAGKLDILQSGEFYPAFVRINDKAFYLEVIIVANEDIRSEERGVETEVERLLVIADVEVVELKGVAKENERIAGIRSHGGVDIGREAQTHAIGGVEGVTLEAADGLPHDLELIMLRLDVGGIVGAELIDDIDNALPYPLQQRWFLDECIGGDDALGSGQLFIITNIAIVCEAAFSSANNSYEY